MPAGVTFVRSEVSDMIDQYDLIRTVLDGEQAIKKAADKYLPLPDCFCDSKTKKLSVAQNTRYQEYLLRAVFYNVTARTLRGMVGEIFRREPDVEMPAELELLTEDANGSGVSLAQLSQSASDSVLAYGRGGLLADFPPLESEATISQVQSGEARPTIMFYEPWDMINWRYIQQGSKQVLSMIVLRETCEVCDDDDQFATESHQQYRVLRLNDAGHVEVMLWREHDDKFANSEDDQWILTDQSGAAFDEIPFTFIGPESNDATVDSPPIYDLAALNVAHYRNSADYEQSVFILGQPMLWASGLTQEWVNENFPDGIRFGATNGLPLPVEGATGILQVAPNTIAFEAMEHKEKQMVALGAKLVENQSIQRTATEVRMEETAETSALESVAVNVSTAIERALQFAARFLVQGEPEIRYQLNSDFELSKLSPEQVRMVVELWTGKAIVTEEMRSAIRKSGYGYLDDPEYTAAAEAEALADMERQMELLTATTETESNGKENEEEPEDDAAA